MNGRITLNEDLFDDVAVILPDAIPEEEIAVVQTNTPESTPEPEDVGISSEITELIKRSYESVQQYNNFITNCEQYGRPEFIELVQGFISNEMMTIGSLQRMLEQILPSAQIIDQGNVMADTALEYAGDNMNQNTLFNKPQLSKPTQVKLLEPPNVVPMATPVSPSTPTGGMMDPQDMEFFIPDGTVVDDDFGW